MKQLVKQFNSLEVEKILFYAEYFITSINIIMFIYKQQALPNS